MTSAKAKCTAKANPKAKCTALPRLRRMLEEWAQSAIEFLRRRPRQEAPLAIFGDHLRPRIFEVVGLGRVGFGVAMNRANVRGDGEREIRNFVKLFDHFFPWSRAGKS